jgi:hypothetical protein
MACVMILASALYIASGYRAFRKEKMLRLGFDVNESTSLLESRMKEESGQMWGKMCLWVLYWIFLGFEGFFILIRFWTLFSHTQTIGEIVA